MGYREGLEAGKLSELQAGFDEGYNETGAPLGLSLGRLLGETDALLAITASKQGLTETQKQARHDLQSFGLKLKDLKLDDLAEPDWEAFEHDLEHHEENNVAVELEKRQHEVAARPNYLQEFRHELNQYRDILT